MHSLPTYVVFVATFLSSVDSVSTKLQSNYGCRKSRVSGVFLQCAPPVRRVELSRPKPVFLELTALDSVSIQSVVREAHTAGLPLSGAILILYALLYTTMRSSS